MIGATKTALGRYEEARAHFEDCWQGRLRTVGPEHLFILLMLGDYAYACIREEDHAAAAELLESRLPAMRRLWEPANSSLLMAQENLGRAYAGLDRIDEAGALFDEVIAIASAQDTIDPLIQAASCLLDHPIEDRRDPARAASLATQAVALAEPNAGPPLASSLDTLAKAQHATGDHAAAVATQERALELAPEHQREEFRKHLEEYRAAGK